VGYIIMDRVIATYSSALEHFLTRRNSSYSLPMFTALRKISIIFTLLAEIALLG